MAKNVNTTGISKSKGIPGKGGIVPGSKLSKAHKWRQRAGWLLHRLYKNALGELCDIKTGERIEMTVGQIRSAQIVLQKFMPDLASQQLVVEQGEQLTADQIQLRMQALIEARPELLQLLSKQPPKSVSVSDISDGDIMEVR